MMIRSLYLVLGLGALIPTAIAAPVALATPLVVRDDQNDCADGIPFGNSIFAGIGWEGEKVKKAVEQPGNEAKYFCGSGWKNGRIITGLSIWGTRGKRASFFC
jgi:hypothetical protein